MQIARVVGTVVSTQKHRKFEGAKLLLVQPLNLDDTPRGAALLAVDGVGAGVHEKVLVVLEGRAAGEALGKKGAPVDAAIVGIVDQVDIDRDSDDELRALVRDAIARQRRVPGPAPSAPTTARRAHASHAPAAARPRRRRRRRLPDRAAVRCNHCGYCLSYGH